jgi:hypothetical protein
MIELTIEEATAIIRKTIAMAPPPNDPAMFDSASPQMQLQMLMGCVGIVKALQELGYRVSRPLKSI